MRPGAGTGLRLLGALGTVAWVLGTAGDADRPVLAALLGAAAAAPLLWQPRLPLACLVAALAGMLLSDALAGRTTQDDPYILMLLWSSYGVGRWSSPRRQLLALAAVLVLAASAATTAGQQDLPGDLVFPVLFTGAPLLLGRLRQQSESQVQTLREHAATLDLAREAELRAAAQEERLRIARELHDVAAHSISALSLQTQVLRRQARAGVPVREDDLVPVERTAQEAMNELRAMLGVLRPASPEVALTPSVGVNDLPALVARSRDAGQDVELAHAGQPMPLQPGLSLTVHRLVQESLTNARRHGAAGTTSVLLDWRPECLTVRVSSPMPASPAAAGVSGGHGLTGMQERTSAYGGRLAIGPDGGAWVVQAELPLQRRPA